MTFSESIQAFDGQPITRQLILDLLKDYRRPIDKIEELISQKILIRIKRGIFIPGPSLNMSEPEPFLLANHLAGPSYVSREAALSYWGLIPEKVFEISSMTTERSKLFTTPAGRFSYQHLPLPYYAFGQTRVELAKNQFALVATAEKAICDTIIGTSGLRFRSEAQTNNWLLEDMRMDQSILKKLNVQIIREWLAQAPKITSLEFLISTIQHL